MSSAHVCRIPPIQLWEQATVSNYDTRNPNNLNIYIQCKFQIKNTNDYKVKNRRETNKKTESQRTSGKAEGGTDTERNTKCATD